MIKYENVFTAKNTLYTREYDTETGKSTTRAVKHIPDIYIPTNESSEFKSIITKENLKKISFKSMKDYKDQVKVLSSTNVRVYGLKSVEHNFIRETYGVPTDNDHKFRTLFLDIETAILDKETPKSISRNDWKPEGERGAMAVVTSIQMYDNVTNEFYILGLNKDWNNKNNFSSEYGKIRYIRRNTEEELLKTFLTLLDKLNPTVIAGWNSEGYDYPYLTMRIIRVLDKREDLFAYNENLRIWEFNRSTLDGGYVKQLSRVGLIKYKAQETNFGTQHTFKWVGYILEDYMELHSKYTYTTLTSRSLGAVSSHELGDTKINHDEFTDFAAFYNGDYIKYNRKDDKKELDKLDILYDELTELDLEIKRRGLVF